MRHRHPHHLVYYRCTSDNENENLPRPQFIPSLSNIKVGADLLYGQGFRRPLDVHGNEQQSSPDGQSPDNCECTDFDYEEGKEVWSHEHHRTLSKCSSIELRSVFDTTEQQDRSSEEQVELFGSCVREIPLLLNPSSDETPVARARSLPSSQKGRHVEFASSERFVSTDTHLVDELHHLLDITEPLPPALLPDFIQIPGLLLPTSPLQMSATSTTATANGFCDSFDPSIPVTHASLLSQPMDQNPNDLSDLGDLIHFG
jgi:hypothetical protein